MLSGWKTYFENISNAKSVTLPYEWINSGEVQKNLPLLLAVTKELLTTMVNFVRNKMIQFPDIKNRFDFAEE